MKADKRRNEGLPIVVGIVGHRDPADADQVAACIKDGLGQIAQRWPQSDIVGLSPLADGVDRIFARELLDAGHRLRVVLPMSAERYAEDFEAASLDEFNELCSQAELITQAPPVADMEPVDDPRVAEYLAAGFYVAQSCHILFAGWDGRVNALQAGTAHIVHARLSGVYDRIPDLDLAPTSAEQNYCPASHMTYLIRTERQQQDLDQPTFDLEFDATWGMSPKMLTQRTYRQRLSDIPNTDALDQMVRMGRRLKVKKPIAKQTDGLDLLKSVRSAVERNADRYITRERARLPLFFLLAGLAVMSFATYGDFYDMIPNSWILLVVYSCSLAGIALVARLQNRRLTASDPTGWRRLSEALRVVIAWHRAGATVQWNELKPGSEFRLTRRDDWVDCAIRAHLVGYRDTSAPDGGLRDLDALETEWIDDQIAYFQGKDKQAGRLGLWTKLGGTAFLVGFFCALASGYFEFAQTTGSLPARVLWFMAGVFPAIGALLSGYAAVLEQNTPSSERDRMFLMFIELKQRIEAYRKTDAPTPNQTRRLRTAIISVGRSALAEVQNWSQLANDAIRKAREFGR